MRQKTVSLTGVKVVQPHVAGVEGFHLQPVGPDHLVAVQHQVDIPRLAQGMVHRHPPVADKVTGADQHFRLAPEIAGDGALHDNPVVGRHDKVGIRPVNPQRAGAHPDRPLPRHREKPRARHPPLPGPDKRLRAIVAGQDPVAGPEILDRNVAGFGAQPGARRKTDDGGVVRGRHRSGLVHADDRKIPVCWRHRIGKQQDGQPPVARVYRHNGVEARPVRDDEGPREQRVGIGGGVLPGGGRRVVQQFAHHPRGPCTKLGVILADTQEKRGAIAFQWKRAALPAPSHPFGQFVVMFCRTALYQGLRPCDHGQAPSARAHPDLPVFSALVRES